MKHALAIALLNAATAWAEPTLKDGDRVIFYGDIGSRSTAVSERVESFFALRYPQRNVSVRHFEIRRTSTVRDATPDFADLLAWNRPALVIVALSPAVISEEKLPDDAALGVFEPELAALLDRAKAASAEVLLITPVGPYLPWYTEYAAQSAAAAAAKARSRAAAKGDSAEVPVKFPYGAPSAEEAARALDQGIARMAESIRRVAQKADVAVIDAHEAINRLYREHGDRVRDYPLQTREARDAAARREALVNALATNATTALLLDRFHAEPLDVRVRFEWENGSVESSAGTVNLVRVDGKARRLALKSLPIPWDLGERGAAWWELDPAARYCGIVLQVHGAPAGGVTISDGTMNTLALSAGELEKGFNLACAGPLPTSQAAALLNAAATRKNQAAARVAQYRKERFEEPEYQEPYRAMLRASEMWLEAYEKVLARTPRTMDVTLELTPK